MSTLGNIGLDAAFDANAIIRVSFHSESPLFFLSSIAEMKFEPRKPKVPVIPIRLMKNLIKTDTFTNI